MQARIGGSFGAKIPCDVAVLAAIAASALRRPVKVVLDRNTDSMLQGGREETTTTQKVWFDAAASGKIIGADFATRKNGGVALELSFFAPSTMLKTLYTCYHVPAWKGAAAVLRSALPSRCPTRSPGEIEGCFMTEEAIDRIAHALGVHSQVIRDANLFTRDTMQTPETVTGINEDWERQTFTLRDTYNDLLERKGWRARIAATEAFNKANTNVKRGAAVVPFRYFVSPTRGDVLVNLYGFDGSVVIHHSGSEMGQGLAVKCQQAAAMQLATILPPGGAAVPISLIRCHGNDTASLPYQHVTGGSMGSEANVLAVIDACNKLVASITEVLGGAEGVAKIAAGVAEKLPAGVDAAARGAATWKALLLTAASKQLPLSATGAVNAGTHGPSYSIWTVGAAEVEVDVQTGDTSVLRVDLDYDAARSLNPAVDIGQAEGAFIMGLGYMLLETPGIDADTGALHGNGTWEYKIPVAANVPRSFNVTLIRNDRFGAGVLSSKCSGEPPLCVAPAITSAVHQAVQSALADKGVREFRGITVPFTNDRIAAAIWGR